MEVVEENKTQYISLPFLQFSIWLKQKGCYEYIIQESVMASWTQALFMKQQKAVEFRMR